MVSDLKPIGLTINPYDTCVYNMMVIGNQMNITWHVNNFKILHVHADEMKIIIGYIEGI